MEDRKKRISELHESKNTRGLYTIGVNAQNESVKVPLGNILDEYDKGKVAAQNASHNTDAALEAARKAAENTQEANRAAVSASKSAREAQEMSTNAADVSKKGFRYGYNG